MSQEIQGFRFRTSARVPYGEKVRLRFDRSGGSVTAVCSDLSIEGMFVATRESPPVGTVVEFEIEGPEGRIARGLSDVAWTRTDALGPGRHAGMGLQFRYVDPASRKLIAEMVHRRNQEAGAVAGDDAVAEDQVLRPVGGGDPAPARGVDPLLVTAEVVLADRAGEGDTVEPAPRASRDAPQPAPTRAPGASSRWLWGVAVAVLVAGAATAWVLLGNGSGRSSVAPTAASEPGAASALAPVVAAVDVEQGGGSTAVIAVRFERAAQPSLVRVARLEDPPRLLVRVRGAAGAPVARLDSRLVRGVASTVERVDGGPELHLVFELASSSVRADWRFEGDRLLLRLLDG
ncbi:MAG TPA: PilZ domain-containing protein [Thermoanaerobaculia bacterium]|nr:PilZ domain-containing protein [Thermoanaerobaculia bacterium]